MSDIIAQTLVGAQNCHFNDHYTSKNNWGNEYMKKTLDGDAYLEDDMDFREPETYKLKMSYRNHGEHFYTLNRSQHEVSNLRMHIKFSDFNNSIKDTILLWKIKLEIGGYVMNEVDMITNLFICKMLKYKIKETAYGITIPITFFDLSSYKKFPLYLMTYHETRISITMPEDFDVEVFADKYHIENPQLPLHKLSMAMCQTQYTNFESSLNDKIRFSFNHPSMFLYFTLDNFDVFTQQYIDKVHLYLNEHSPIIWDSYEDEIIKIKIFGKIIYFVSLISDVKVLSDIRKMFKYDIKKTKRVEKEYIDYNGEKRKEHRKVFAVNSGINFSRIGRMDIKLIFSEHIEGSVSGKIGGINLNIQNFMCGMCGVSYAS